MATLNENIARVKADFKAIKGELVNKGASIPSGTPTSQYANIIKNMSTGSSEEAYEQGRQDVIAESKYIEKSEVGKVISLTDVSEVSHKVKVYGDNQEVDVYGKNLLPYPYYETTKTQSGLTITDNGDGSITVNGTATNLTNFEFVNRNTFTLPSGTYGFSLTPQVSDSYYLVSGNIDAGAIINYASGNRVMTTKGELSELFILQIKAGVTLDNVTFYPQIEVGDISNYEPYTKQTITATPVGTEIESICPNMTFITYSDAEENLLVEYYSSFGMQTEYDRFWDSYQANGTRTNYANAFAGLGWTDETFKPKYDIVLILGAGGSIFNSALVTDIGKSLKDCGVTLDTSRATNMSYAFANVKTKTLPKLDFSSATVALTDIFSNCTELHTADEMVFSEKTILVTNSFRNCSKFTHCIFSGVIASDINLQWSPLLDDESLVSISVALCDLVFSGFGDGWGSRTWTLSAESIARLKELPYPPDDLNPEGQPYAEDGASCYEVIVGRKGWNIA